MYRDQAVLKWLEEGGTSTLPPPPSPSASSPSAGTGVLFSPPAHSDDWNDTNQEDSFLVDYNAMHNSEANNGFIHNESFSVLSPKDRDRKHPATPASPPTPATPPTPTTNSTLTWENNKSPPFSWKTPVPRLQGNGNITLRDPFAYSDPYSPPLSGAGIPPNNNGFPSNTSCITTPRSHTTLRTTAAASSIGAGSTNNSPRSSVSLLSATTGTTARSRLYGSSKHYVNYIKAYQAPKRAKRHSSLSKRSGRSTDDNFPPNIVISITPEPVQDPHSCRTPVSGAWDAAKLLPLSPRPIIPPGTTHLVPAPPPSLSRGKSA